MRIEKMRCKVFIVSVLLVFLLLAPIVFSQSWPNPGHPAWQIGGGAAFNASYGNFLFPAAVNLTADTTTFHVDATGDKVGIGTTSPKQKLDVNGTLNVTNVTLYSNCAEGEILKWSGGVGKCGTDSTGGGGGFDGGGSANNLTKWVDADTLGNSSVYETGGYIGIGTTSPNNKLEVNSGSTAINSQLILANSGTYHTGLIGTSNPSSFLSDTYAWGIFGGPNSYLSGNAYSVVMPLSSNVPDFRITAATNLNSVPASYLFTVKRTGNVGIGTSSPGSKLDVVGDINASSGSMIFYNELMPDGALCSNGQILKKTAANDWDCAADATGGGGFDGGGSANNLTKWVDADTLGNSTVYETGGLVGIGTDSPDQALKVNGNVNVTSNLSVGARIIIADGSNTAPTIAFADDLGTGVFSATSGAVSFAISGSEKARIDNTYMRIPLVLLPMGTTELVLDGQIADGASAIAVKIRNTNALTTAGAKIVSFQSDTAGSEKAYIDKDGTGYFARNVTAAGNLSFDGEIMPDGALCSANQILKKTAANDWDCAADATGGGGFDGGGGGTNNITKWVDADTLGNSSIYESGGKIGIGTTSPSAKLSVGGTGFANTGIYGEGTSYGVNGVGSGAGVVGTGVTYGVYGSDSGSGYGVWGSSSGNVGVYGGGGGAYGVYGAGTTAGVYGRDSGGTKGGTNYGYLGASGTGVYGYGTTYAGDFAGTVRIVNMTLVSNCADGQILKWSGGVGKCGTDSTGGGGFDGGGSMNNITKWVDADTLGNSSIYETGGNIGIGTIIPSAKLSVGGAGVANAGVYGAGSTYGVYGYDDSTHYGYLGGNSYGAYGAYDANINGYFGGSNMGAYGQNTASTYGSLGYVSGVGDYGAYGSATSASGTYNFGVYGVGTGDDDNYGVVGTSTTTGNSIGVLGSLAGVYIPTADYGVFGMYDVVNYGYLGGIDTGVYGRGTTYGGYFLDSDATGDDYGVYGAASGAGGGTHYGGNFYASGGGTVNYGVYSYGSTNGIVGTRDSPHTVQSNSVGVYGAYDESNSGYIGGSDRGVYGKGTAYGGFFENLDTTGNDYGVYGVANGGGGGTHYGGSFSASAGTTNYGVYSYGSTNGIVGTLDTSHTVAASNVGVYGAYDESNYGYLGANGYGVNGTGGTTGVWGEGGTYGVYGRGDSYGVYGYGTNYGVYASSGGVGQALYTSGTGISAQFTGSEVRVGDSGTVNYANADGDLYVEDALEADGAVYFVNVYNTANTSALNPVLISSTGQLYRSTSGLSSIRYKENIAELNLGLDAILNLHPVTFDFKKEVAVGPREVGFIAEEVENVSPLLVGYLDYVNENNESVPRVETVKYEKIAVVLTKAIQEQQKEITSQREEIGKLREANTKQDAEIKTLRESIQHLQQQMR